MEERHSSKSGDIVSVLSCVSCSPAHFNEAVDAAKEDLIDHKRHIVRIHEVDVVVQAQRTVKPARVMSSIRSV